MKGLHAPSWILQILSYVARVAWMASKSGARAGREEGYEAKWLTLASTTFIDIFGIFLGTTQSSLLQRLERANLENGCVFSVPYSVKNPPHFPGHPTWGNVSFQVC